MGLCVLSEGPLPQDKVVVDYDGSMVYLYFSMKSSNPVFNGDGMIVVTAERFRETGMDQSLKVRDQGGSIYYFCIFPSSFC